MFRTKGLIDCKVVRVARNKSSSNADITVSTLSRGSGLEIFHVASEEISMCMQFKNRQSLEPRDGYPRVIATLARRVRSVKQLPHVSLRRER